MIIGEAQDEPNIDPFLKTPEVGRGIADFMKGTGGASFLEKLMLAIKIFVVLFVLVVGVMILFIKPGILVN